MQNSFWPFEYLPIPCLYLDLDHVIIQANNAARKLIISSGQTDLIGVALSDTNFEASFVEDERTVKECLQLLHRGIGHRFSHASRQTGEVSDNSVLERGGMPTLASTEPSRTLSQAGRASIKSTDHVPVIMSSRRSSR